MSRSSNLTKPPSGRTRPAEVVPAPGLFSTDALASAVVCPQPEPVRVGREVRDVPLLSPTRIASCEPPLRGRHPLSVQNRGCFGDVPRPPAPSCPSPSKAIPYHSFGSCVACPQNVDSGCFLTQEGTLPLLSYASLSPGRHTPTAHALKVDVIRQRSEGVLWCQVQAAEQVREAGV